MVVIALVVFMLNLITAIHYLTLAIKVSLIADAWIIAIFVGVPYALNLIEVGFSISRVEYSHAA